ncbi:hypothetical protein AB6A40_011218 [Gnathostoma spinigerum]|uniref:Uncharacterized protein n=1 Tax=Gnathostoma spinigerum TaxID=75299 RepID=A0ABD6EX13_9BILA
MNIPYLKEETESSPRSNMFVVFLLFIYCNSTVVPSLMIHADFVNRRYVSHQKICSLIFDTVYFLFSRIGRFRFYIHSHDVLLLQSLRAFSADMPENRWLSQKINFVSYSPGFSKSW